MFRTKRLRTLCIGLAATAIVVFLAYPGDAKAHDDCAPYISGRADNPASGTLSGTRTVSITIGASYGVVGTVTVTVTIGVYIMSDGDQEEVRCDTYEQWNGPGDLVPRQ